MSAPAFNTPSGPAAYSSSVAKNGFDGPSQQSRKRSYNESQQEKGGYDSHYGRGDRQMKQMRRGGMHNGRGGNFSGGPDSGYPAQGNMSGLPLPPPGFQSMPMPPAAMPFDPNDPIGAILAMQAMGFPPMPGMPDLSQAIPPTGFPQSGRQGSSEQATNVKRKISARCRDYDTKGLCERGHACPFEHGDNRIVIPGQQEGMSSPSP